MEKKVRILDLFSGIGGFTLAAEHVWGDDLEIVGHCDINDYCEKVLEKNFPGTPYFKDVQKLSSENLGEVNIICGGFPCQDISQAGKGLGIEKGERSGLWSEFHRLIGDLRPTFAVIENVSALTLRGLNIVLRDLAEIGYDAEWQCIGAYQIGAKHRRDRIWVIAYPNSNEFRRLYRGFQEPTDIRGVDAFNKSAEICGEISNTNSKRPQGFDKSQYEYREDGTEIETSRESRKRTPLSNSNNSGDRTSKCQTNRDRQEDIEEWRDESFIESSRYSETIPNSCNVRPQWEETIEGVGGEIRPTICSSNDRDEWLRSSIFESRLGRMAYGIPNWLHEYWGREPEGIPRVDKAKKYRKDRLMALGNSIVPQIPMLIFKRLKEIIDGEQVSAT